MKRLTICCALLAVAVPSAAASAPPAPIESDTSTLKVVANPDRAGARPVALTLRFQVVLRCASPGVNPITVTLPAAERVPNTVSPKAVLVNGTVVHYVSVQGRRLTVTPTPPSGVTCDSIAIGTLKLVVTRAARLGNPRHAGTYTVAAQRGTTALRVHLTIRK